MMASKTDVWRELVQLLSTCPTEHVEAVACLLFYILDDDGLNNHRLIVAIKKTRAELGSSFLPKASPRARVG